jgi:hypothetical protein
MVARKPGEPDARASMATQRISLDDLDKLRRESRAPGPLPGLPQLFALLGASLDDDAVDDLGVRPRLSATGYTASSKALGIELAASKSRVVETVLLHGQGHEGFHAWPGDLGGITFSSTPAQLKKLLGAPARTTTTWDRWDEPRGLLQVEYGGSGVQLITLTARGAP